MVGFCNTAGEGPCEEIDIPGGGGVHGDHCGGGPAIQQGRDREMRLIYQG